MNDVTLKELMETRIASVEQGIALARHELDRRLEGMNEFREQLNKQAASFVTREAVDLRFCAMEEKIASASKGKMSGATAIIIAFLSSLSLGLIIKASGEIPLPLGMGRDSRWRYCARTL
ncbi:hypothetical protein KKA53_05060 [Candidatus Dependentiae bacterium]|nr:hypothetical protein [Candidatus Dependentiae bacterium]